MVPADSRQFSRSRRYLGCRSRGCVCFGYGAVTHSGRPFQSRSPTQQLGNSVVDLVPYLFDPTTPKQQRHQAWHCLGLVSTLFARRYSGCRGCFPFLTVLRCFNSRGSLLRPYVFRPGYHSMTSGGFPIRTSAARCLVDGSPQLFAVTHVLHRFLAPRHPPLALCSLEFN